MEMGGYKEHKHNGLEHNVNQDEHYKWGHKELLYSRWWKIQCSRPGAHFFLLAYFCESMRHTAVSTEEKGCQNLIAFRRVANS